jgi:hypothetical protein
MENNNSNIQPQDIFFECNILSILYHGIICVTTMGISIENNLNSSKGEQILQKMHQYRDWLPDDWMTNRWVQSRVVKQDNGWFGEEAYRLEQTNGASSVTRVDFQQVRHAITTSSIYSIKQTDNHAKDFRWLFAGGVHNKRDVWMGDWRFHTLLDVQFDVLKREKRIKIVYDFGLMPRGSIFDHLATPTLYIGSDCRIDFQFTLPNLSKSQKQQHGNHIFIVQPKGFYGYNDPEIALNRITDIKPRAIRIYEPHEGTDISSRTDCAYAQVDIVKGEPVVRGNAKLKMNVGRILGIFTPIDSLDENFDVLSIGFENIGLSFAHMPLLHKHTVDHVFDRILSLGLMNEGMEWNETTQL